MTLGESLKRFRKEFHLTQQQTAQAINILTPSYQRYEYDTIVPAATILIKLADAFNVSIDYLVGRSDNPQRL